MHFTLARFALWLLSAPLHAETRAPALDRAALDSLHGGGVKVGAPSAR